MAEKKVTGWETVTWEMEPPPGVRIGPLRWVQENLFSSWFNALLTVFSSVLIVWLLGGTLKWVFTGADWNVITLNLTVFAWGRYPDEEAWRIGLGIIILLVLSGATALIWPRWEGKARPWLVAAWLLSFPAIAIILYGFNMPTLTTISNNLGYYLAAPWLMPIAAVWRPAAALLIVSLMAGLTWGARRETWARIASGFAVLLIFGLGFRIGLLPGTELLGVRMPRMVNMVLAMGAGLLVGRSIGRSLGISERRGYGLIAAWVGVALFLVYLLTDFPIGLEGIDPVTVLPTVPTHIWSGILLTMVLSIVGIVGSFPIGVLLALGRRSKLPVVKVSSIVFIEVVRGVPMISILFMAQVMLPLFLPLEWRIDQVVRAMIGMTLFTAAYLAEVVRGGLQAVPNGQIEAARAVGLNDTQVTTLVVLPQALRTVIPAIMGQFVSLFKDTSLVAIVGLLDVLAVAHSVTSQPEFIGKQREVYLFAGIFYLIVSYSMSYTSRRLETRLGVGERR
jgi:general L-amino acid transport system permease protein